MKTCTKCQKEKPAEGFAVDRSKRDGRKAHCKQCDAASKKRSYYAGSAKARSSRTTRQRNRRWREVLREHGERWAVEQVQALKQSGRLTAEASACAERDQRLAAFFREADRSSAATLRTHLGARLWDRVARPFVPAEQRKAETAKRREEFLSRFVQTEIVALAWNEDEEAYEGVPEAPESDETFGDHLEKEASDRVLRRGRFARA